MHECSVGLHGACSAKTWQNHVHLGRGPRPTHHQQLSWHADNDTRGDVSVWRAPRCTASRRATRHNWNSLLWVQNSLSLAQSAHAARLHIYISFWNLIPVALAARSGCCKERRIIFIAAPSRPGLFLFRVLYVWSSRVRPSGLLSTTCVRQRGSFAASRQANSSRPKIGTNGIDFLLVISRVSSMTVPLLGHTEFQ